jgi:hypothetical protein
MTSAQCCVLPDEGRCGQPVVQAFEVQPVPAICAHRLESRNVLLREGTGAVSVGDSAAAATGTVRP